MPPNSLPNYEASLGKSFIYEITLLLKRASSPQFCLFLCAVKTPCFHLCSLLLTVSTPICLYTYCMNHDYMLYFTYITCCILHIYDSQTFKRTLCHVCYFPSEIYVVSRKKVQMRQASNTWTSYKCKTCTELLYPVNNHLIKCEILNFMYCNCPSQFQWQLEMGTSDTTVHPNSPQWSKGNRAIVHG